MSDKYRVLKEYFGHDSFRGGQEKIIDNLLAGRDVLCIMPTGAGKSICYQTPAMLLPGITLVVSPLISLMQDQVMSLTQSGVPAAYINSSLTPMQYGKVLQNMKNNRYKIIYVAPERLESPDFLSVCRVLAVSLVAVDEAHCISQWGQDFRPGYLRIADFIRSLPTRPTVGAFTATATDAVKEDIRRLLCLEDPFCITTGFDRPNLYFGVEKPQNKISWVLDWIEKHKTQSGILYCSTRKTVEEVCETLSNRGISVTRYHAGLSEEERRQNQEDFVYDRKRVMVATNAFGMGIDKSDVSYVVHYNMPKNMESYYQEAGRAGRDGGNAECILLYAPRDVNTARFLISQSGENSSLPKKELEALRERDLERLKQMTFYCTTDECLRHFILNYFGENSRDYCGNCSSCLVEGEMTDITVEAQKILCCIARTGQRYGKTVIVGVLRGGKSERILSPELKNQSTYGILKEYRARAIRHMIDYLEQKGYLRYEGVEYPILMLTDKSLSILRGEEKIAMRLATTLKKQRALEEDASDYDASLLEMLKRLRYKLSLSQMVPAYVVFTDATLTDMCRKMPSNKEEFLNVSGVGNAKYTRYGETFLKVIREWKKKNREE